MTAAERSAMYLADACGTRRAEAPRKGVDFFKQIS